MSDAAAWLAPRIEAAPESLRTRMMSAVTNATGGTVHDLLAAAAADCLKRAMEKPSDRASALDLLAADALLTHACEAAAEQGGETLRQFTSEWNPERFETLL